MTCTLYTIWSRKTLIFAITGRFLEGVNELLPLASAMTWVESTLNFTNGYYKVTGGEDDQFEYLVPFPPGYTSTMKAYWTTDVIVLNPSCSWQTATRTAVDWNSFNPLAWNVIIPESNLSISMEDFFGMFLLPSNVFICLLDN